MFTSLLIANRGEVACRVMRTCKRLGIRTIAVYSDADADARHVREADQAIRIGPASARESYLDANAIIKAALDSGAQAIHPGYGFLSEKLELIDACAANGIVFIGPHRDAIARMGSKIESKRIAREAGVQCVPGYDGDDQSAARLADEAARIGFPLLIKASAGGGGKGMKRVDVASDFMAQLLAARTEAQAAFGDDKVLIERYVQRPRHLEVQLLGDRHGGLVHLMERECSIQRNYQKVIEEAPAANLNEAIRTKLFDAAIALGKAIAYDSVGTVEFVLDADQPDEPYFLEMNTRLQVEHPVTELSVRVGPVSLDLVECQIRAALGERVSRVQSQIHRVAWAIEARVNAEVPDDGFGASVGRVDRYEEPRIEGLRIDSGIDAGSVVTPHYDAMLAKVIAVGPTRAIAKARLIEGLRGLRIEGVRTNQALLIDIVRNPAFDQVLTTRFLADTFPDGWKQEGDHARECIGAAAAAWAFAQRRGAQSDRPLDSLSGFRLTASAGRRATTTVLVGSGEHAKSVVVEFASAHAVVCHVDGNTQRFEATDDGVVSATLRHRATVDPSSVDLVCDGDWQRFDTTPAVAATRAATAGLFAGDVVTAAMPGVVTRLLVAVGQRVASGKPVAIMEAMKLMHTLVAPRDGIVSSIAVREGTTVGRGTVLVAFEAERASQGT
jgi:3-methylcrotonyl-CoA carboxylase alpha subunit